MTPIAINGASAQDQVVNGVQVKQTLSAASETVAKGVYEATTLSAVDSDLAEANIITGATIFGIAGSAAAGGTATFDIEDEAQSATLAELGTNSVWLHRTASIAQNNEVEIATLTQSYTADSVAVAYGFALAKCSAASAVKLRLYMNGVQVAESAYISNANYPYYGLIGYASLSGSMVVNLTAYNYSAAGVTVDILGTSTSTGAPVAAAVFAGSVKVV